MSDAHQHDPSPPVEEPTTSVPESSSTSVSAAKAPQSGTGQSPNGSENVPVAELVGLDAKRLSRRKTLRSFAIGGTVAASVYGFWRWIATRPEIGGVARPLRRVLEFNEQLGRSLFSDSHLAREFDPSRSRMPKANGRYGLREELNVDDWKLVVNQEGDGTTQTFTMDDLYDLKLPRVEMVTELMCIEGWSQIVHWSGFRFADFAARLGLASRQGTPYEPDVRPDDLFDYVSITTPFNPDNPSDYYYVGLDMPSALHPQTLLCDRMQGEPLEPKHGAPLRLVIPVKYGVKNIKRIGQIQFQDTRPDDFWAERGYDWYVGL